uniref:Uncharacterized protein n=1 Tax=Anguilla anguilla TaxID=7936 RepID=A0A0E9R527_ANGAN
MSMYNLVTAILELVVIFFRTTAYQIWCRLSR